METARPAEIEPLSNRYLIHPLAAAILPRAIALGVHPNLATLTGLGFGVAAGLFYLRWHDWRYATAGLLMMLGWHVMDGLDGKLARATGKCTAFGRLLDGVADYSTFVVVNIALAVTSARPALAIGVALVSGAAHALQSQFYEGERVTYIRRLSGCFAAVKRSNAGGLIEHLYNCGEAMLGNRTRPIDRALACAPAAVRAHSLSVLRPNAARVFRCMAPLSANGRTLAIWLAALAGNPMLYWIWEIGPLTLLAVVAAKGLRRAERRAMASASGASVSGAGAS